MEKQNFINNEERLVLNVIYAPTVTERMVAMARLMDYKDRMIEDLEKLIGWDSEDEDDEI